MANRSQLAYDHIRSKLVKERIDPRKGLSEPGLARELKISRTPVREAIRRLESEGLLEQRPKKGTFVRQLDEKELDEIYQVRLLLEPFVAAEAASKIDARSLKELERLAGDMRRIASAYDAAAHRRKCERHWAAHRTADVAFHEVLLRAAGNERIAKIILDTQILMLAMSFPETTIDAAGAILKKSHHEHSEILRAVRERDARLAQQKMHDHIAVGWASVREFMASLEKIKAKGGASDVAVLPAPFEGRGKC